MNGIPRCAGRPDAGPRRALSPRRTGGRRLACSAVLMILATTAAQALGGPVDISSTRATGVTGFQLDESGRSIAEVERAIKSFQKRDFDLCLKQLSAARAAHPELPPAEALFAKLAFLFNQGALIRPALERAVAEDGQHPEVFILFGNLALAEGRVTDAAVHFEKATSLSSAKRWTSEQQARFQRLSLEGHAAVAETRADWKAARSALEAWLKHEPDNSAVEQRLGKAMFQQGEHDAAYEQLEKAARRNPALEPPAITMTWLYTRSGNLKKAEEWIDYANKTSAGSPVVQMETAAWLLEHGRADEAQSHVDQADKLRPGAIEIKRLRGLAARQRKDFVQAEQIFDVLAHDAPADPWPRNQLASCLAEQPVQAKRQRALELAELSVRQNPKAVPALSTLGMVFYRLNRLEDAEKVLQAVAQSSQASSDALYVLAHVRADRGHAEDAPALLRMALDAQGIFVFRKDAQEWLDRLTTKSK
jgi:tetratricopeptide (TPR) repeat protein